MAGSFITTGKIIAALITNATGNIEELVAEASKECTNCKHRIDNSDVSSQWSGLPDGVKFEPTDLQLLGHLEGKVGRAASHVLIDDFIPTIKEAEGICYTHPENLLGIKMDGGSSYFFHRISNAYDVGQRKRRKISNNSDADCDKQITWHQTGKSKPILDNGVIKGWKKIQVLHKCRVRTKWTMHQWHLGSEVGEKHRELVVSRVFCQVKNNAGKSAADAESGSSAVKIDPATPNMYPPQPRRLSGSPLETAQNQDEEEPSSSAAQGYVAVRNADIHENPVTLDDHSIDPLAGLHDLDSTVFGTLQELFPLTDSFWTENVA